MKKLPVLLTAFGIAFLGLALLVKPATAGESFQDDQIAQGRYIATIAGCTSCHTPNRAEFLDPTKLTLEQIQTLAFNESEALDTEKFLGGGKAFPLGPAGVIFTRNITPDESTGIGSWSDAEVRLAIQTGVDKEGRVLFPLMPYHVYNGMAESDITAVIAFLRSVKAVSNAVPPSTIPTEGMPTPPLKTGVAAPDGSDPAARGAYLVNSVMGCTDCHTPIDPATGAPVFEKYLAGGQPYEGPWGTVYGGNITPDMATGIGDWNEEEIKRSLVSGIGKDGRRLILMPWYAYTSLTQEDADAVAFYLKNVLPAVNNEIPATALNPEFVVMAPGANNETEVESGFSLTSPLVLVIVGLAVIVIVTVGARMLRRKTG